MSEILSILRDIVLMRRGPQDLPYSPAALAVTAVLHVILMGLIASLMGEPFERTVLHAAVATGLNLGVLYLILMSQQRQERFNQTALAIQLISLGFAVVLGPLLSLGGPLPAPGAAPESFTGAQLLTMFAGAVIGLWSVAIEAHVLRNALETRFVVALLILLSMRFAVAVFILAVFGSSPQGT